MGMGKRRCDGLLTRAPLYGVRVAMPAPTGTMTSNLRWARKVCQRNSSALSKPSPYGP